MYIFSTILKVVIMLIGVAFTVVHAVPGFINNDKKRLKKAALIFISTWVIVVVFSVLEFAITLNK